MAPGVLLINLLALAFPRKAFLVETRQFAPSQNPENLSQRLLSPLEANDARTLEAMKAGQLKRSKAWFLRHCTPPNMPVKLKIRWCSGFSLKEKPQYNLR